MNTFQKTSDSVCGLCLRAEEDELHNFEAIVASPAAKECQPKAQ